MWKRLVLDDVLLVWCICPYKVLLIPAFKNWNFTAKCINSIFARAKKMHVHFFKQYWPLTKRRSGQSQIASLLIMLHHPLSFDLRACVYGILHINVESTIKEKTFVVTFRVSDVPALALNQMAHTNMTELNYCHISCTLLWNWNVTKQISIVSHPASHIALSLLLRSKLVPGLMRCCSITE